MRLGVDGSRERVIGLVSDLPFVREATSEDDLVRLYVDRGEVAVPQLLRVLDGEGLTAQSISLHRPSLDDVFLRQTGRSLRDEPADLSRLTVTASDPTKEHFHEDHPRDLADLPPVPSS